MFWGWVSSPNDSMWLGLGAGWERILSFLMIVPDVLSSVQLSCPCLAAGSWEAGSCPPSPGQGRAPQEGGVSLQEATSVCDGSQHPHSTFLDGGTQGPQTLPAASPPNPNTPRTLRAAPQILLTCSWLPHFARTVPFTGNTFPHLLRLEKSSSSPKARAQIGEGARGYHIFPPATCQAPSKGRLLSVSPTAARAPTSSPFYRWGTWGYLLRVAQCQRGPGIPRAQLAKPQSSPVHAPLAVGTVQSPEQGHPSFSLQHRALLSLLSCWSFPVRPPLSLTGPSLRRGAD